MPPSDEKPDADKPKRSQRAAWELYPDAQNADAACLADKIISKAQRKWDKSPLSLTFETLAKANETSRNEMLVMAKSEWNNLNQREQNEFPNTARVALARKLPLTQEGHALHSEILGEEKGFTEGFQSWNYERINTLMETLRDDPIVNDAKQRWDTTLNIQDKLFIAQHIQNIQAETFGAVPVPVIGTPMGPRDHGSFSGSSESGTAMIKINTTPGTSIHASFPQFLNTLTHEGTHGLQEQIASRYNTIKMIEEDTLDNLGVTSISAFSKEGLKTYEAERDRLIAKKFPDDKSGWNSELIIGGKLAAVAPMFKYNLGAGYMAPESSGFNHYQSNPIESHARQVGYMVEAYFLKTRDQQNDTTLKAHAEDLAEGHNQRNRDRAKTFESADMCP